MSPEAQRIAIAEACGMYPEHWHEAGVREGCDYLNDLNAMHEAEKVLTESQRREYFYHMFGTQRLDDGDLWKAVHTTAAQRAEAFLRTLDLWSAHE